MSKVEKSELLTVVVARHPHVRRALERLDDATFGEIGKRSRHFFAELVRHGQLSLGQAGAMVRYAVQTRGEGRGF